MTDDEIRLHLDNAVTALKATTSTYQTWLKNLNAGKYPNGSKWGTAFDELRTIRDGLVTPTPTPTLSDRWFSPSSSWNTPISSPVYDPNEAAYRDGLIKDAAISFVITWKKWSVPVFYADASTPKYDVAITASWAPARKFSGVPIPTQAIASSDTDGHMAVIDKSTGCVFDFYGAVHNADGTWSAKWANSTRIDGMGWYDFSATGSGEALCAGLIRPEEMQAGVINHALKFAYTYTRANGPVLPAMASDGNHVDSFALPEGALLQFDPGVDPASLGLKPYEIIISKALQKYGMYLTDSSAGVGIPAQNPAQGQIYPWPIDDYINLNKVILNHMRVLKLPPQYKPSGRNPAPACGTFS